MNYSNNDELRHHGVLGMKWGVRRYQNKDGTLTAAGRKHYSREYARTMKKADRDFVQNSARMYVNAHNKTLVDQRRNGKLDDFNKIHNPSDADYMDEYNKMFSEDFQKNYLNETLKFMASNEHAQRGKELVKKYELLSYDELAQKYESGINKAKKIVNGR